MEKSGVELEREAILRIVEVNMEILEPVPIGPLYGAGWEACREAIARAIRKRNENP